MLARSLRRSSGHGSIGSLCYFFSKDGNHCSFTSQAPTTLPVTSKTSTLDSYRTGDGYADINWDELGFGLTQTDYMYMMKCSKDDKFSCGELSPYGNIELNPSSAILNYGQGVFEGLKAYRKQDGRFLIFRPQENAIRMQIGAERLCMNAPSIDQFVDAVKQTVLANKRWIPPPGKGSLYIRPLLIGSGPVLALEPAPEYTFLVYTSPVGNYFKEGRAPLHLVVEDRTYRSTPGGTGGIKTIANYAPVLKAQCEAKAKGFTDILFLDSATKENLEEAASCNVFILKDNIISTPDTQGTILPGVTRKSIIDIARTYGYQVDERPISIEELMAADEVFCTGTAVVVAPVGSITHLGKRVHYKVGELSQKLYTSLTGIQMGLLEDKMGWTVEVE
ncbi:hypothetical protein QJS10_CPB17g02635 [Acorus calamus]|uniref:Branched-chain-amino-acid aminotransferase n=1 Tax=Acorus calamus TaxID=4465 RepID=A0AAV9CY31_ACOCL|nr:hypothetical protein QJS10_CPB17g02635 [Acorus calamus]